jgi:CrcB protein
MMPVLYVALGGAIGAVLRYGVIQQLIMRVHPGAFPLGTMLVNILGALCIGMIVAKTSHYLMAENARLFLVTGVLGGFTTFSAFSIDTLQLFQRGEIWQAVLYVTLSVLLSLAACALGYLGMRT